MDDRSSRPFGHLSQATIIVVVTGMTMMAIFAPGWFVIFAVLLVPLLVVGGIVHLINRFHDTRHAKRPSDPP